MLSLIEGFPSLSVEKAIYGRSHSSEAGRVAWTSCQEAGIRKRSPSGRNHARSS